MFTETTVTNKIQVTPKQLLELKTIKHWAIENIKYYEKCYFTMLLTSLPTLTEHRTF